MSTRGTYLIKIRKEWENFNQCFYCHSDNYPSGAAEKFKEALALTWKYQINGKNFLKRFASVDGSEFTTDHFDHGDTEYRYNIHQDEKDLLVTCYELRGYGSDKWTKIFDGSMNDFIEKYLEAKC